jgi:multiple sugar transport system permease protein
MSKELYQKIFFLSPFFLLMLLVIFPLFYSIYISFFKGFLESFCGLENYFYLFQDPRFISTIKVTLTFTIITVTSQTLIGLLLAFVLLQPEVKNKSFWQTIFLLPLVIPPIVAGVMFKILYHPSFGPFSYLSMIKISPPLWLEDPNLAIISVSLINNWMWTPFTFLIFYTGMRAIPHEIIESANLDGASGLDILTKIIFPYIKTLILIAILFRSIDNLIAFDEIMGSTAGGPAFATTTFAIYIYKLAFKSWDLGYASAASVILFIITTTIAIILIKLTYFRR